MNASPIPRPIPARVPRPKLALWLFERNLSLRDGADYFDTTPETMSNCCHPFGDGRRRVPYGALMQRIVERSGGELRPADFYEPALNAGQAQAVAA